MIAVPTHVVVTPGILAGAEVVADGTRPSKEAAQPTRGHARLSNACGLHAQ